MRVASKMRRVGDLIIPKELEHVLLVTSSTATREYAIAYILSPARGDRDSMTVAFGFALGGRVVAGASVYPVQTHKSGRTVR